MQRYPLNVRDTEREILAEGAARVQHRYQERMEILSLDWSPIDIPNVFREPHEPYLRSEEHTSELQSLMRISYAVFCLKKKNKNNTKKYHTHTTIQQDQH